MHAEEIDKAKKLIQTSNILSSVERAEWVQLLADMNDKQVLELIKILTPRPAVPKPPAQPAYHLPVDIYQKEISSSIPFYEKELTAPTDPTHLQNHVENIVKELHHKAPIVPSVSVPIIPPKPPTSHTPKMEIEAIVNAEDFAKIEPSNLHERDPHQELQKILVAMSSIAKTSSLFDIIKIFQTSPLYQAYLKIGLALLEDPSPDRDEAYEFVVDGLKKRHDHWLSKMEFEAFADFRKRLEQMI